MSETAPDAKYVLVPAVLTEDMAAALECAYSTEGQWEAALAARPAALSELREAEEAVIKAAKEVDAQYGPATELVPPHLRKLRLALARLDQALAVNQKKE